ncbi:MAG: hypothetical protein AAF733_11815 [Verrucomicrobiota bacterium]
MVPLSPLPILAMEALTEDVGWVYYVVCAAFFTICGLASGYFIWRKGNMQMHDAELEVRRTTEELHVLREDLREEELGIRVESEETEIQKIVP